MRDGWLFVLNRGFQGKWFVLSKEVKGNEQESVCMAPDPAVLSPGCTMACASWVFVVLATQSWSCEAVLTSSSVGCFHQQATCRCPCPW